jgi:hypothetical protein
LAALAFLAYPSIADSAILNWGKQKLERPEAPRVYAVAMSDVIGFLDFLNYVASQDTSAQFEAEPVSSIGDYELLPYEPRDVFVSTWQAADDLDEDGQSAGLVVYANNTGFQYADSLLQLPQFYDNRIAWESLFVWSPPTVVGTDMGEIAVVIFDRNQMRLRSRPTPEPASLMIALPGLFLLGLNAKRRSRNRA